MVDDLHALMIGVEPDLTILIDMDPTNGLERALSRQTAEERFEDFGVELQAQMRAGFLNLAKEFSDRFRVLDGGRDIETVARDVTATVAARLG